MTATAEQMLNAARRIATKDSAILNNRWQVTSAALARQSVEGAIEEWMTKHQVATDRVTWKVQFLCLRTLHSDPPLIGELHQVWCRLSDACHATSYEMPPTDQELNRWFTVIQRFLATG